LSGFIAEPGNPLSRMTAASLGDLGYQVDLDAAEPYVLPNLQTLAEAGALVAHVAPIDVGIAPPVIPMTPPPDSLQEDDGDVTAEDRHSGDKLGTDSDAGVMLRPESSVLPNEALVPERNLVRPAPNRFTHELLVDEPYRFDRPERDAGRAACGGPLIDAAPAMAAVSVEVRRASLRKLPHA
jgi:hypothetical protein